MKTKIIMLLAILGIICFFVGYLIGAFFTIKAVVYVASGFIEIDYDLVYQAITQYRNNIGECYIQLNHTGGNTND